MVKNLLRWGSKVGMLSALVVSFAFAGSASAATTTVACEDLPTAIAAASAGDTLNVTGDCTLTKNTTINKQLTINGVGDATISTSGTAQIFMITADDTTIQNLNFVKTDEVGPQNIIGVQADNVSILNNNFTGQYDLGDGHVSRAVEVSSVSNVTISGNTFNNLRQPAYINTATGTVSNNYTDETRGFVILADSNIYFTGNTWGNNAEDIAIIPGTSNNYPCDVVRQIVVDNDNADVDHQMQTEACPTYPMTKDECKNGNYSTFTGMTFKNQGQCVSFVASNGKSNS